MNTPKTSSFFQISRKEWSYVPAFPVQDGESFWPIKCQKKKSNQTSKGNIVITCEVFQFRWSPGKDDLPEKVACAVPSIGETSSLMARNNINIVFNIYILPTFTKSFISYSCDSCWMCVFCLRRLTSAAFVEKMCVKSLRLFELQPLENVLTPNTVALSWCMFFLLEMFRLIVSAFHGGGT